MLKRLLLGLIGFYQRGISPALPPACRYHPSCSAYAKEAILRYGALRGSWLACKRLLRCHPFGGHGYDPVPELNRTKKAPLLLEPPQTKET